MTYIRLFPLMILLIAGCAQQSVPGAPAYRCVLSPAFAPVAEQMGSADKTSPMLIARAAGINEFPVFRTADSDNGQDAAEPDDGDNDEINDSEEPAEVEISDPLEPFNRAMFQFNDKLYFWILKPAAQGYKTVVPESARTGVSHFFENARFPIRFVNNLLQLNIGGAFTELGRFAVNTLWGIGGFLDPASREEVDIGKSEADLGQTLGMYGVGNGFYIVWPVLGPSSARDSVRIAGEYFLDPVSYINPVYASFGTRAYEAVNDTSLRIGDYEALKESAIDPYIAMRSAYIQYREGKIRKEENTTEPPTPTRIK